MTEAKQLCIVEDTLSIAGRDPIIIPGQWQTGQIKPGDWLELRSESGERHFALVKSIEGVRFRGAERRVDANNPGRLLLAGIRREVITRGDEVWSAKAPTRVATTPVVLPHKSWRERLFKKG